jgi:ABC-2 type transport system ATP-binding protein
MEKPRICAHKICAHKISGHKICAHKISAHDLGKSYGDVTALTGVTVTAEAGRILGVLGHNGAGKTTLVDILATRVAPTAGRAEVCGFDVLEDAAQVRRRIGVAAQFVAVDEGLSGRANLVLLARLLGARRRQAEGRAAELLTVFGLDDAADRLPATYSGGMRRRLDLAAALLGRPEVLFLDEPSTGLDPVARVELWGAIGKLAADGTTVVLTTQDLQEAEALATDIVVLGAGHVVARGTPAELKGDIAGRTATVTVADPASLEQAGAVLLAAGFPSLPDACRNTLTTALPQPGAVADLVRTLDRSGVGVADIAVAEPTLNDVYFALHRAGWKRP